MTFEEWLLLAGPSFPGLTTANSRRSSPFDEDYNCIAWAAENTEQWWWPDPQEQKYWPPGVPRAENLDAFVQAYGLCGYTEETDASLEIGKQKVAIFASAQGKPTHASRQLPDGLWTSKMGMDIDIEHELAAVEGPVYGRVAIVLARSSRVEA